MSFYPSVFLYPWVTKFSSAQCSHTSCVEGRSAKLFKFYPNFVNSCKDLPKLFEQVTVERHATLFGKIIFFAQ